DCRASVSTACADLARLQIRLAPAQIRAGLHVLFVLFCAFGFLRLGFRRLGSVSRERRVAALMAFSTGPVPQFYALERVPRSMTLVAFLEHPDVLDQVADVETSTAGREMTSP